MLNHRRHTVHFQIFVIFAVISGFFLSNTASFANSSQPGGDIDNPAVLAVDISRVALVRIMTTYHATVRVNICDTHYDLLQQDIQATGSGAFISPHGDILTADHVVDFPLTNLQAATMQILAPAIAIDTTSICKTSMTASDVLQRYANHPELFTLSYSAPVSIAWLDTSLVGHYMSTSPLQAASYPLHILAQSPYDKNDVAILHANLSDMPSISIGDSSAVAPTDLLTILGYPSNADLGSSIDDQNTTDFLTASLNAVYVSALKSNANGGTLLQVGGNIEHGDSGGPALNVLGQLVGVVSFGVAVSDPNDVGMTRFLQASSSVLPLIAQAQIDAHPGPFQLQWSAAMRAMTGKYAGHWRQAQQDFTILRQNYPLYAGIAPYLSYVQTQHDISAPIFPDFLTQQGQFLILGAAIGSLLMAFFAMAAFGIRTAKRRRKHRQMLAMPPPTSHEHMQIQQTGNLKQQSMYTIHETGPALQTPDQMPWIRKQYPYHPVQYGYCSAGHRLRDNEAYCTQCGARRAA